VLLSSVCPAPCEKICRRKDHDQPVAIQTLIRFLTEQSTIKNFIPQCAARTAHAVAVCGAGPAGLSASFYLLKKGHAVSIFEKNARACEAICSQVDTELNLPQIMERETARIRSMGADFHFEAELGKDISLAALLKEFDAVIVAVGGQTPKFWETIKLEYTDKGAKADSHTFATQKKRVFVCGAAGHPTKLAANAVNRGRQCALAVDGFLSTGKTQMSPRQFDSRIGKLEADEIKEYLPLSNSAPRIGHSEDKNLKFTEAQSVEQAGRCLHCDCRKASHCALRDCATRSSAKASRYKSAERKPVRIISSHPSVVYEPGKCIKCGRCVRITRAKREALGLTFIGRGFNIEVGVPFNQSLRKAMTATAAECVRSCPTGALAFYEQGEVP
jgi:ferredoxin